MERRRGRRNEEFHCPSSTIGKYKESAWYTEALSFVRQMSLWIVIPAAWILTGLLAASLAYRFFLDERP